MKIKFQSAGLVALIIMASWFAAAVVRAQQAAAGHASDFSSVAYFDPPNEKQMKSRLSGAEASPEAGGLLEIKQLKLEKFGTNGVTEAVVEAPECVYDMQNGVASSAGHLQLRTGDGNLQIEGDGFLWRQKNQWLTISNHVQTVIKGALESKTDL
ncbi:MAG TPA: hypothetical protein VMV89_07350 [Candidatus Paceibacterota bacterium]|nr:hypothetical protein [Candidatus Paceibacterota bacterium]